MYLIVLNHFLYNSMSTNNVLNVLNFFDIGLLYKKKENIK